MYRALRQGQVEAPNRADQRASSAMAVGARKEEVEGHMELRPGQAVGPEARLEGV